MISSAVVGLIGCFASAAQFQIDGRTFTLPDGFTIEKVAGPPLVNRPIVADVDEQGRLYVDDSSGSSEPVQKQLADKPHRVVRLSSTRRDGTFDRSEVFAEHLMFPEGAMWYAGSLYVGAPPSIWKLTDTSGCGAADQRVEWFEGKTLTGCANDIHGPYLGPDGWIYWCKGAFAEQSYPRPGKKPFVTRAAHIFRARPDGSGIEPVMTGGMDNPVHVVFTDGGERLFTTTFLVNPAGGQRDGIIHAVYGGIYGKIHDVIDDHPHTFPQVMPVLVHLGPAAACGLCRYQSDVLGADFRNNLFATCFNLHKVTRHVLTPQGATFAATNEDFLTCDSVDFHPTDVIEDADGSLLVIDTGGWYKLCCPTSQIGKPDILGAIYRIRRTGAAAPDDPRGLNINWRQISSDDLARLLSDPRPAVRTRAIQALAERGSASLPVLRGIAQNSKSALARINAVWASTRIADPQARQIARSGLRDADETVRQAAAHSASVWRDGGAFDELVALLRNSSAQNRRVAAEALGRLADPRAVPHILDALRKESDHVLNHSLTYALIEIDDPKSAKAGLASEDPNVRRSALMALDQMENGAADVSAVIAALNDSNEPLRETAAWIASRHPNWGAALADAMRRRIDATLSEPEQRQLESQLARLASSEPIQQMLAAQLSDPKATVVQRRIALAAMSQADLHEPPPQWIDGIINVLKGGDDQLLPSALNALGHIPLKDHADVRHEMLTIASRAELLPDVRLHAMRIIPRGLPEVNPDLFAFLCSQVEPSQPPDRQLQAAEVLGHAKLSSQQLSALTDLVKTAGPLEIEPLLSAFAQTTDEKIGQKLAESLKAARSFTALRPDAVRQVLSKLGSSVARESESLIARLNPDAGQQRQRLDDLDKNLPQGDVRRGQAIFNSTKAACMTCHAIGYVGGNVGPDLTRVGAIRTRRDLLESILYPSASFVQSFEPTMVVLKSGERQYGIIRGNSGGELLLITGPNQQVRIPTDQIEQTRPGTVSLMPAGFGEQLSRQELADLVAFLQNCR